VSKILERVTLPLKKRIISRPVMFIPPKKKEVEN